ncbi:deleted in malignant brain tumors 1 protein-like isoform X2 [Trematomus bernacchii]|uniref:deleted in malignant brain tumors 1 protein-like isoform X2 n=1 Tax=Trematomus bernacchii TaxID=40690 RepID=UPI00146BB8C9|nr:deleted in malignant brain tumors 1 protein-like isoform X2 [Trematomus bernacchii]
MWTLVVLCSVIASLRAQGADQLQQSEERNLATGSPDSCLNSCGNHVGNCSCSSSCGTNGDCCPDYYDYCSSSAETAAHTARPSCRYNCGWDMGSCSCTSSCQYYGNCCHDYNYYCPASTTQDPYVTPQPSCRYNCGRHMGSCSCSSSCQYNGNCCNDYYSYCQVTTDMPATASPCGGSLSGSGSVSSPNHPNNYHDNANCVWQLIAAHDQRIFLSFDYLQLENCCDCDYINVYDGPSVNSRFLGKVCNDSRQQSTLSFYSTSNYMTVLFRTDGSVVGRGFNADFISSLPESSASPCGGSLSGSGSVSSPNHPNNYHDNANCVWQLSAAHDQRIFLSFDYLQLENCCDCDYINVYDGPSVNSRFLGKVCSDSRQQSTLSFYSTSNYMTVLFRTDGSVVGQGFNADFISSLPESSASPCGGSLYGSGSFSSPNHPNNYHDNANCVWQLSAAHDQRIFLSFDYLQLENCCDCDYINVYDGPSVNSRFLGKVCNDSRQQSTFYSTSNYMTVVFRTDGSVVGRGFNADFISSLPESSGRVDCSSDNMNIVIERSYLNSLGYDGHSLYLNDQYCRPQVSSYQVVFNFPINTCGNVRKFENGRIVYTNSLRAYASTSGEITRQSHFKMNVGCRMEPDSVSQIMYVVRHNDNSSITGTGRFNTSMAFYTSNNFYYQVTEVPYMVTLNQYMYVQVDLRRGDSSLVLYLDTCVTSPSPHDLQNRSYYLVRNGCPVDNTYYAYVSGTRPYARFRFQAFQFLRATESLYIQCKVLICPASDNNSRCRRGCYNRAARDVGSKHDSQTLVLGPIQFKEPEKQEEETPKQEKA